MNMDDFAKPKSHHVSDVDVWKHADRNFYMFIAMTFLFGFVGLDHMYLRSNETAFKKLLLNIFGLGIWYVWDIIQVLKDGKTVRKYGLNSPFDWIRGIGRGMFAESAKKGSGPEYAAPKSYFVYTLLAVCLGAFGADRFYVGSTWQGLAKLFSVFNIFLFLFGIMWVIYDAFQAYFMTRSVMKDGISTPLPFSWFFGNIDPTIFQVQEVKEEPKSKGGFFSSLPLPSLPGVSFFRDMYKELVVPVLQPTVGSAIQSANKVVSVGTKVAALGSGALAAGPAFVGDVVNQMNTQVDQAIQAATAAPLGTTVEAVQQAASAAANARQQTGGAAAIASSADAGAGATASSGPGPILAGAMTAILIAGGLKGAYDFLEKQTA